MPILPDLDAEYPPFQLPGAPSGRRGEVIAVSELNRRVRGLLEANLALLWVSGELSNVMRAASGHWYFSLKDATAQVRCVMFRHRAAAIGFTPENGMQVEIRALPSLYEPRGEFQLGVETMRRGGLGALYEAFERLKARLLAEGLFSAERKRPLPAFPKVLGIVTSLKAAALRDVLTTLQRRAPMIQIIIYPSAVQGTQAAQEIAAAIDSARSRIARDAIEALIICRGGGSIEDLWSFNEEIVARAIVRLQDECGIPVVSGVGHETDFTICDFVADRRAPTP
ncbi:MAG: exodeoxyribonuclease VII large subunit, partial [Betaproteobacteria bacterium]